MEFSTEAPIVFGAGAFNAQYEFEPELNNVPAVSKYAFDHGINTIDTSAAYGKSEEILGNALSESKKAGIQRESYRSCTKCCRWETNEFEFSRETVSKSVDRSLKRSKTDYVDILYIHDVEFGTPDAVMEAIETAFELKAEGKARGVGISGYPLNVLVATAKLVQQRYDQESGLDVVSSYCNSTSQNNLSLEYKPLFEAAGVKTSSNASPLSMSSLRSGPTHGFHPASPELRERADEIGRDSHARGLELADVATQYAIAQWKGPTVIGLRTIAEIDAAIANREKGLHSPDTQSWQAIIHAFGKWHNYTWVEDGAQQKRPSWAESSKSVPGPRE